MKLQKVYDDAHTAMKIVAAKTGKSSLRVSSQFLRFAYAEWEAGRIELPDSEDEPAAAVPKRRASAK